MARLLAADQSKAWLKLYHASSLALAGLVPAAVAFENVPAIDYGLAIAGPLHGHIAMNFVISDYVPMAGRTVARAGLLGLSVASVAGLMKLNHEGPGVTATLRKLWKA